MHQKELNFRRGRAGKTNRKSEGIFQKLNNAINAMSGIKFAVIVVLMLGLIGYILFASESARSAINQAIKLPGLIDTNANCNDLLNPGCWTDSFFPKLPQTDEMTNALLIGLDTRESGSGSGLMNTDTIMLASYDHKTNKVYLISFPRDLYVPYKINGKGPYFNKINAIYAAGETSKAHNGMDLLKENIENWFDIKIHYTAKVNFNTVVDMVDSLGGVNINLDKVYTDVYPYKELPKELQKECVRAVDLPAYCVFKFEAGEHKLDGEKALIYARMRQYSSDFDRARRQQEVVNAIKDKFLEGDMNILQKAKFAWDTYGTIMDKDNVQSNISYNDLLAGMRLVDKADLSPIQIVLDPSFGGGGYFVPDSVEGIYVVKLKGNSFDSIMAYINKLKENPDIYKEQAHLLLINSTGKQSGKAVDLTKQKLPFKAITYLMKPKTEQSGTAIYVFNQEKAKTIEFLKEYFDTQTVRYNPEEWDIKQSGYKEDILVIEGPVEVTDL